MLEATPQVPPEGRDGSNTAGAARRASPREARQIEVYSNREMEVSAVYIHRFIKSKKRMGVKWLRAVYIHPQKRSRALKIEMKEG